MCGVWCAAICHAAQLLPMCLRTLMSFLGEPGSRLLHSAVFGTALRLLSPSQCARTHDSDGAPWSGIGVCAVKHGETEAGTLAKEALPNLLKRVGTIHMTTHHPHHSHDARTRAKL